MSHVINLSDEEGGTPTPSPSTSSRDALSSVPARYGGQSCFAYALCLCLLSLSLSISLSLSGVLTFSGFLSLSLLSRVLTFFLFLSLCG
jgi:hypothetical protein